MTNTCLLPGCNAPIPENDDGRPRDFCCDAHRQVMHRLVNRVVKIVVREIAAHPLVGSRLPIQSGAAVPSSQPLPGAALLPNNGAGQGGEAS